MNGENELGFHLGDGATAILVTGDEYHDVFPLWDWRRVPGVTCAFPADAPPPRLSDRNRLGGSAFAGGVSDDEFGVAAMRVSRGGVEANKAWFFLGDSVLCLGNSIASADPRMPVITSVNQTWARGPIVGRNGVLFTAGRINETNGSALAWVHHDGIGYVFPGGGAVRSGTERKSSSWRAINRIDGRSAPVEGEVFSVWLEHGRATVE